MDRPKMTLRRRAIYEWMLQFFLANQRMPSYREIARQFKFKAHNAAWDHVARLVASGMLVRENRDKWSGHSNLKFAKVTFQAVLASC